MLTMASETTSPGGQVVPPLGPRQIELMGYLADVDATLEVPEWSRNVEQDLHWSQGEVRRVAKSLAERGLVGGGTFLSAQSAGRDQLGLTPAGKKVVRDQGIR